MRYLLNILQGLIELITKATKKQKQPQKVNSEKAYNEKIYNFLNDLVETMKYEEDIEKVKEILAHTLYVESGGTANENWFMACDFLELVDDKKKTQDIFAKAANDTKTIRECLKMFIENKRAA